MKKVLAIFAAIMIVLLFIGCEQISDPDGVNTVDSGKSGEIQRSKGQVVTYKIVLENLASATGAGSSQPLSPPIIATHAADYDVFNLGQYASDELRKVAEDAANTDLVNQLSSSSSVYEVVVGSGVVFPGSSETYTIHAELASHKLSLVSMLVNTNDGFAGADKINLPNQGTQTYYLRAYDAGTEANNELKAYIPGPCCGIAFSRDETQERISYHKGIRGIGDLDPDVYGWDEPIVKLTITKM